MIYLSEGFIFFGFNFKSRAVRIATRWGWWAPNQLGLQFQGDNMIQHHFKIIISLDDFLMFISEYQKRTNPINLEEIGFILADFGTRVWLEKFIEKKDTHGPGTLV